MCQKRAIWCHFFGLIKRHLWRRLQGDPRNTGFSATTGPVPLTIPQCYTHWPGMDMRWPAWTPRPANAYRTGVSWGVQVWWLRQDPCSWGPLADGVTDGVWSVQKNGTKWPFFGTFNSFDTNVLFVSGLCGKIKCVPKNDHISQYHCIARGNLHERQFLLSLTLPTNTILVMLFYCCIIAGVKL